jgi:hypothetical protein
VHLSDFNFTESASNTNDPTKSHDPTKSYDPTRSVTNDALRQLLTNPLGNKGKERVIGVSGGDMERLTSFANLSNDSIPFHFFSSIPLLTSFILPPFTSFPHSSFQTLNQLDISKDRKIFFTENKDDI